MKKRRGGIIAAVIAIVLFFIMAVFTGIEASRNYPDYTVFSSAKRGASLLYDALGIFGVNMETGYIGIDWKTDIREVHVLIEPYNYEEEFGGYYFPDISEVIDFVDMGGKVIIAERGHYENIRREFFDAGAEVLQNAEYSETLALGDGFVMLMDSEYLLNEYLRHDRSAGNEIAMALRLWDYDKAVFNEYYHGYTAEATSMWADLPLPFKLFVIQVVIAIGFFVISESRRFGKPIPLYEEIERTENEYIHAMANLFHRSKQYDAAAESYYRRLLEKAAVYFKTDFNYTKENLEALWRQNNLPRADLLSETVTRYASGFNKARLKTFVSDINELIKHIGK